MSKGQHHGKIIIQFLSNLQRYGRCWDDAYAWNLLMPIRATLVHFLHLFDGIQFSENEMKSHFLLLFLSMM